MIPSTRNLFFPRFTHADCSSCIRKVVCSRSLQRDSGGSADHDLSVVDSCLPGRQAYYLQLCKERLPLLKAHRVAAGIKIKYKKLLFDNLTHYNLGYLEPTPNFLKNPYTLPLHCNPGLPYHAPFG